MYEAIKMTEKLISQQVIDCFIENLSELKAIDDSRLESLKSLLNADKIQKADIKELLKEDD
jgi:SOS response regulatory protein OraA/RecX